MSLELRAGEDDRGRRLDRILRKCLPDYSLSLIHRLLRQEKVRVNGKAAAAGQRIQAGDVIRVIIQENGGGIGSGGAAKPHWGVGSGLPLPEILWRGAGIVVFNKPAGMAAHGAAHGENSLDTLVGQYLAGTLPPSLSFKPGPLHRLDKPTSGAIAFSETLEGARLFSRLLRERKVTKTYLAIVEGRLNKEERWEDILIRDTTTQKTSPLSTIHHPPSTISPPHPAVTAVKALATNGLYSLIEARILTGRTHQIRAQAAFHGHPLAGDTKYGGKKWNGGLLLHAWKLEIDAIEGFPRPLIAPLPPAFAEKIEKEKLGNR